MIGKVTVGASFYGCLSYCLEDKRGLSEEQKQQLSLQDNLQHKDRAEIIDNNLCFGDKRELVEQFHDVAKLSKRVEKPVMHLTIRSAPGDQLTVDQWREVGRAAAQEFGLADHQYVCILHKDTWQPHIHLVGNRVGYNGKVASDSNSYARIAKLCRQLEQKYNLHQVLSPRRFLSPKERQIPRQDERKEKLKTDIRETLRQARTYPEFEKAMQEKGYRVEKGRGISFVDSKKVRTKGSEVAYSLMSIERILVQNAAEDRKLSPSELQEKKERRMEARQKVGHTLEHHRVQVPERTFDFTMGKDMARGVSDLIQELLKPVPDGGGGRNPWADEEERRKKKKKNRKHLCP